MQDYMLDLIQLWRIRRASAGEKWLGSTMQDGAANTTAPVMMEALLGQHLSLCVDGVECLNTPPGPTHGMHTTWTHQGALGGKEHQQGGSARFGSQPMGIGQIKPRGYTTPASGRRLSCGGIDRPDLIRLDGLIGGGRQQTNQRLASERRMQLR